MDISRLKVAVPSYQITEEGGPVAYMVTVQYGKLSWDGRSCVPCDSPVHTDSVYVTGRPDLISRRILDPPNDCRTPSEMLGTLLLGKP